MKKIHWDLVKLKVVVEDSGQDLIEYALLGALLAVACVTAISSVASKVQSVFTSIVSSLS